MSKDIDALDTLDDYSDEEYSAFLEYTQLKDQCMIEPTTLYINDKHEFLSEWEYFAKADGLEVKHTVARLEYVRKYTVYYVVYIRLLFNN